ncbi:hypothetical protein ACQPZF_26390 [Actinosynnema sp. CS-041913]|uniref:hypothetical protein n=1 Tax=Actinosynnema sp. CS-041913 TaxID=3239917 RepID=UPI003D8DBA1F
MTWSVRNNHWNADTVLVGNDSSTNAYAGDTSCDVPLPVLCLKKSGLPLPAGVVPDFYNGWTGGEAKLTPAVSGYALYSRAAADGLCAAQFGPGYRMGEHHDGGGGWNWWARGDLLRTWVAVNDQPANPWNTTTGKAMTWSLLTQDWNRDLVDFHSDIKTDGYHGDTPTTDRLPVLCLRPDGRPAPDGIPFDFYNGWAAGEVKLSSPVRGTTLTSRTAADNLCATQFGPGYRMGEHHDGGGGWGWWASGDLRFWVAIDDQPANPWN